MEAQQHGEGSMTDQQSVTGLSMTMSKDSLTRTSELHRVFQLLDEAGSGRLDSQAMRRFALLTGFSGGDAEWKEEFRLLCEERHCTARDGLDEASFIELINDPAEGCSFCSDRELHEIHEHLAHNPTASSGAVASATSIDDKTGSQSAISSEGAHSRHDQRQRHHDLHFHHSYDHLTERYTFSPNIRDAVKRKIFWLLCPAGCGNTIGSSDLQRFAQLTGFEGDDTEWNCEFNLLCKGAGITDNSLSEDVFVSLLDDTTDKGLHCDDEELVKVAEKLVSPMRLPVPWHRSRSAPELRSLRREVGRAIFNILDIEGRQILGSDELCKFATMSGFAGGDAEWCIEFHLLCKEQGCHESNGLSVDGFLQLVDDTSEHGCYCNDATLVKILAMLASQQCAAMFTQSQQTDLPLGDVQVLQESAQQHVLRQDAAHMPSPGMDSDDSDQTSSRSRAGNLLQMPSLVRALENAEEAEITAQTESEMYRSVLTERGKEWEAGVEEAEIAAQAEAEICRRVLTEKSKEWEVRAQEVETTAHSEIEICTSSLIERGNEREARAREQHEQTEAEVTKLQAMLVAKEAVCQERASEFMVVQSKSEDLKEQLLEAQQSVRKEKLSRTWEREEMMAKNSILEMHLAEVNIQLANQKAIAEKQVELMQINVQILMKEHAYAEQRCEWLESHCQSEAPILAQQRSQLWENQSFNWDTQGNIEFQRLTAADNKNKSLEAEIQSLCTEFGQKGMKKDVEIAQLQASVQEKEQESMLWEAQLRRQASQECNSLELKMEDLQNNLGQLSASVRQEQQQVQVGMMKHAMQEYEIQELSAKLEETSALLSEARTKDQVSLAPQREQHEVPESGTRASLMETSEINELQVLLQEQKSAADKLETQIRQDVEESTKAQMQKQSEERSTALELHIQGLRSDLASASAEHAVQMEQLQVQRRRTSMVKQDTIVRMREELAEQQEFAFLAEAEIREEAEEKSASLESKIQGLHDDLKQTQLSMHEEQQVFRREEHIMSKTKEAEIEGMQTELSELRRASQETDIKSQQDDPRTRAVEAQLEALRSDLRHISQAMDQKRRLSNANARRSSVEKVVEIEQMQAELQEHRAMAQASQTGGSRAILRRSLTWPPEHSDDSESSSSSDEGKEHHRATSLPSSPTFSSSKRRPSVRFADAEQNQEFEADAAPSENSPALSPQSDGGQDEEDGRKDAPNHSETDPQELAEEQDVELLSNYDDDIPPGEQDIGAASFFSGDHHLEHMELAEVFRMEEIGYCRKACIEYLYVSDEGAKVVMLQPRRRRDEPMRSTLLRINKAGSVRREFENALLAQEYFGHLAPRVVGCSPGLARLSAGAVAVLQIELMGSMCSLPGFSDVRKHVMPLGHLFTVCRDQGLTGQHTVWPKFFSFLQALFQKIAIPGGSMQKVTLEDMDIRDHLNLKPFVAALVPGIHLEQITGGSTMFGTDSSIDALVLEHFSSQYLSEEDDLAQLELIVEELYYSGFSEVDGNRGRSELMPVMFFFDLIIGLSSSSEFSTRCTARMGYTHGDLHLNNVLYDEGKGADNDRILWIMDFEHVHRGHQFVDLARCLTVGLFLHSRVDDSEREQHLRTLVRIIASTPFLTSDLPEPEPEMPGSVRFIWAFTAQMLSFCKDVDEAEEDRIEESGVRTSTQLIWALLYSSLQLFTDCHKWQNTRRKRLVMYACIAFALRLRLELHPGSGHMPRWLGNDREAWNHGFMRQATIKRRARDSIQSRDSLTSATTAPWFAMQFLQRLHHQHEERCVSKNPLEQHAAKCHLQKLCEEVAWAADPFTGVSYSVLSEITDMSFTQTDEAPPVASDSLSDNSERLQRLLEKRRRVLIVGAAGSGKTLQTRQLLTYMAKNQLQSEVQRLPLRASFHELVELTVKNFDGAAPPGGKLLEAYMEMHMSPQCCTMFQLSREHGWLLVLDGAEDALGHNEVILQWLDHLLEQEPRHQVLMTARPEALREAVACADPREGGALLSKDWLQQQGFVVLHLRQLGHRLLWRTCMRHHGASPVDARKKLFSEARRPEYREVVTTPLLALMTLQYIQNHDRLQSEGAGGHNELGPLRASAKEVNAVFLYKFSFAKMLQGALAQSMGVEADKKLSNRLSDAIAQICSSKQEQRSRTILKADFEDACRDSEIEARLMELWHLAMCGQFHLFERVGLSLRVCHASMQDFLAASHAWTVIERGGEITLPRWLQDPGLNVAGASFNNGAMRFFADLAVKRRSIASGQFAPLLEGVGAALRLVAALGDRRATNCLASLPLSLEDRQALLETRSTSGGWTALHLACAAGHEKVVIFLLECLPEARPSLLLLRDDKQRTPLHLTAIRRTSVVLKELLAYTKENPGMLTASDNEGKTALNLATGQSKLLIARSSLQVETSNAARLQRTFLRQPTPT